MAAIDLNFYVVDGKYGITADNNLRFGTDGIATCVGIIAKLNNGTNFCGHMNHTYEPNKAQKQAFIEAVIALLEATIPLENVTGVYYSAPGGTLATKYTLEAINTMFPNATGFGGMCIYIDTDGTVKGNNNTCTLKELIQDGDFSV